MEVAKAKAMQFLEADTAQRVLLITGSVGTGKTMLANDIARTVLPGSKASGIKAYDVPFASVSRSLPWAICWSKSILLQKGT